MQSSESMIHYSRNIIIKRIWRIKFSLRIFLLENSANLATLISQNKKFSLVKNVITVYLIQKCGYRGRLGRVNWSFWNFFNIFFCFIVQLKQKKALGIKNKHLSNLNLSSLYEIEKCRWDCRRKWWLNLSVKTWTQNWKLGSI